MIDILQSSDLRSAKWKTLKAHPRTIAACLCTLAVLIAIAVILHFGAIWIVIFTIGCIAVPYSIIGGAAETTYLKAFAPTLGFTYEENAELKNNMPVTPVLFSSVEGFFSDILSGSSGIIPVKFYRYDSSNDHDSKKSVLSDMFIFQATYPYRTPHMLILTKEKATQVLPFEGSVSLTVEGNFSDHFTVLVEKDRQLEALEILTPNMMTNLLEKFPSVNMELCGNDLFVIHFGEIADMKAHILANYQALYALANNFEPHFRATGDTMRDALSSVSAR